MKHYKIYFVIFSLLFIKIYSYQNEIQNGVYLIKNLEGNLNLKIINSTLYFSSNENKNQFDNFHFYKRKIKQDNEYESEEDTKIYYYIEEKTSRKKLYFDEESESVLASETIKKENEEKFLWEIKINKNINNIYYEIKSKLKNRYISYEDTKKEITKAYFESSWNSLAHNRKTKFMIIKLYKENDNIKGESELLDKEPIDVVIKYIDLNDTSLDRAGLEQIYKDNHNNELKYSLRSIIYNIPWVRKIFIIMPNEKILFLKEKEEIKDRIIYIKDNQILDFESSSPPSFQFNLHKLKKYGLSENFILMDDDYFIAQPLSKSDFFFEEKGKIYPLLISTEYFEIDEDEIKSQYMNYLSNINDIYYHSKEGFNFRRISTLLFLNKILEKRKDANSLIEVGFTHNAIPLKISDVEEVYEYIEDKYQHNESCLRGKKRNIRTLQPQILFMSYARNKYDRPAKEISWKYYDLSDVRNVNLESKLFVINVEDKEYNPLRFKTEEEILNSLFPNPTKYENVYENKNEKESKKEEKNNTNKDNTENMNDLIDIYNGIKNLNKTDDDNKKEKKESEIKNGEKKEEIKSEKEIKEKKEDKKEEKKEPEIEEKKDDTKLKENENEKNLQKQNIDEKKEVSTNKSNNDVLNEKIIQELKQEIKNQKIDFDKKYNQLFEEVSNIKSSINKTPQDNSLLNKKLQEFNDAIIELSKKISSLEKDNTNLIQSKTELEDKIENLEKKKNIDDDDEDSLKNLYNNLYKQSELMEKKINDLVEDNSSINSRIGEIKDYNENKGEKLKEIIEENDEMKKKIKNYENEINEWKKKVELLENELSENRNKNSNIDEQINRLNYEISELKNILNKKNEKEKEKKGFFDGFDFGKMEYFMIFVIILVLIYFVYIKYFKNGEEDSQNIKHMRLSQQYSGYGSVSNNLM